MKSILVLSQLKKLKSPVFRTVDAATLLGTSVDTANKSLSRLKDGNLVLRICRGLWAFPEIDPYLISEYLTAPFPSYISLQSAMYLHGMISQIPHTIYIVSLARTRFVQTPFGSYSIHHVNPDFFFGFDVKDFGGIKLASPEKTLLDVCYLSPAKSHLFGSLPEIHLPPTFKISRARQMIRKIRSAKQKTLVENKLEQFLSKLR